MNYEEKMIAVSKYILANEDELLRFFSDYLSHESINPDLKKSDNISDCHSWLAKELEKLSIFDSVDYWDSGEIYSNLVAVKKGKNHSPILFCGHTDTVPVTETQQNEWRKDAGPWDGKIIEGKVFGRGANDMKSGNAAALMAIKVVSDLGFTLSNDIYLGFVMTEESGNRTHGVDEIINRGYSAKAAVVMEPSDMKIVPAIQGEFYFKIKVLGKSSHIASRHLSIYPHGNSVNSTPGVNAIDLMQDILSELATLEKQLGLYVNHELMQPGATTINISEISSKGIFSALAEECTIVGSMIYSPSLTSHEAVQEFRNAISRVTERNHWLREHPPIVELPYFLSEKPPVNLPVDHWLCKKFEKSLRANKLPLTYDSMISTSDGNYLADFGIDVITFGPGASYMGMHGCNEYVPVRDYLNAILVYSGFLID
jgi:acetylornithine deacetylase